MEIDESLGEPQVSESPEQGSEPSQQPEPQSVLDLGTVEKFKFKDQEWTTKDLDAAILRQQDYTRKTQELAQERKYYANLSADLELVKTNPALAAEFKKVYPSNFHGYLNYVSSKQEMKPPVPNATENPDVSKINERLEKMEAAYHERQVEAANAEIDSVMDKMGQKYPLATPDVVLARAQSIIDQGQKLTSQTWEAIYKSVEDQHRALFEKHYKAKVKEQTEANQKAKDTPSGGAVAGRAPTKFKNLKEAENALMEHMNRQG